MDVAVAGFGGQPGTVLASLIEIDAMGHDLGAEAADGRDLDRVRRLGHADNGAHPEEPGSVGDRLPMVAGGGGDHTAASLVVGQLRYEVDPAPDLEGADRLVG